MHPDYSSSPDGKSINDIALVRLPRLAQLNQAVRVVCLPINPQIAAEELGVPDIGAGLEGFYPTVVGWGHTKGNVFDQEIAGAGTSERVASQLQMKLAIPVLSNDTCSSLFSNWTPYDSQICAGGEEGKDSCGGDSGGPLYMRYVKPGTKKTDPTPKNSEPWYLLGVVSFGSTTCGIGKP